MSAAQTYEVYAVRYGTRETRRSEVYLNFSHYGEPDRAMTMDYFFWVVRNASDVLLVDCGFDEAVGMRRGRTSTVGVDQALRGLDIDPAAVDQLLITHAHYDHIGNLGVFPHARLLMSAREFDFWTGPLSTRAQFASSCEPNELAALRAAHEAGRVSFVDTGTEPLPGVRAIEVGGHTPGQLILTVPTDRGQVVLASDALHYYEELERDWPFIHAADLAAMYAGFDSLAALAAGGAVLVAGHDPEVTKRFPPVGDAFNNVVRIS